MADDTLPQLGALALIALLLAGCAPNYPKPVRHASAPIPIGKPHAVSDWSTTTCPNGAMCVYIEPPKRTPLTCLNTPADKCKLKSFYWGEPATYMKHEGDYDVYLDRNEIVVAAGCGKP